MAIQNQGLENCINLCHACADKCEDTLFNYCLEEGGKHSEPSHVRLMADCIEICRTSAAFMVRQSSYHSAICRACAEICEACAASCNAMEDKQMKACAEL